MRACVLHSAEDLRVQDWHQPDLAPDAVRIEFGAGGICGSDLHYFFEGRVGDFDVVEPFVLGHEVAGRVAEIGGEVTGIKVGDHVAVDPSMPCRQCTYCRAGRENLCTDMYFLGSARRRPHTQGVFQELLTMPARQCHVVPQDLSFEKAACGEPLAVCLHAVSLAGPLLGARVLVTGSGPIGALIVAAARRAGAKTICTTDVVDPPLATVRAMGADTTINVASDPDGLDRIIADDGGFDVCFEASGNAAALATCFAATANGATIVQVGIFAAGKVDVPTGAIMGKELRYFGSFRFHREFGWAIQYIANGLIDIEPILTKTFPMSDAPAAFHFARDRSQAMKVHLAF